MSAVIINFVPALSGFIIIRWCDADHCVPAWSGSCSDWETVLWRADRDCRDKLGNFPPSVRLCVCPSSIQPVQLCSDRTERFCILTEWFSVDFLTLTQKTPPISLMNYWLMSLISFLFTRLHICEDFMCFRVCKERAFGGRPVAQSVEQAPHIQGLCPRRSRPGFNSTCGPLLHVIPSLSPLFLVYSLAILSKK